MGPRHLTKAARRRHTPSHQAQPAGGRATRSSTDLQRILPGTLFGVPCTPPCARLKLCGSSWPARTRSCAASKPPCHRPPTMGMAPGSPACACSSRSVPKSTSPPCRRAWERASRKAQGLRARSPVYRPRRQRPRPAHDHVAARQRPAQALRLRPHVCRTAAHGRFMPWPAPPPCRRPGCAAPHRRKDA